MNSTALRAEVPSTSNTHMVFADEEHEKGRKCYCTGYAGESHAWNIVALDDGYYNIETIVRMQRRWYECTANGTSKSPNDCEPIRNNG